MVTPVHVMSLCFALHTKEWMLKSDQCDLKATELEEEKHVPVQFLLRMLVTRSPAPSDRLQES